MSGRAQEALDRFNAATKTIALAKVAESMGAAVTRERASQIYTFSDGSELRVSGRGRGHKVEVR